MVTRPCLISASRSHLRSKTSDNESGSKPTSPAMEPSRAGGASMNGMDFDAALKAPVFDANAGPWKATATAGSSNSTLLNIILVFFKPVVEYARSR